MLGVDQIDRLQEFETADCFTEQERAVIRLAKEVTVGGKASDATWEAVAFLGERQRLELVDQPLPLHSASPAFTLSSFCARAALAQASAVVAKTRSATPGRARLLVCVADAGLIVDAMPFSN